MTLAAELSLEIVEIVGPDVTYVRTVAPATDTRYHITGPELASALAAAVLIEVCKVVYGWMRETKLGERIGHRLHNALAALEGAEIQSPVPETTSTDELRTQVQDLQVKLDEALAALKEERPLAGAGAEERRVVHVSAGVQVTASLESWGLPPEKARRYAAEIADQVLDRLEE